MLSQLISPSAVDIRQRDVIISDLQPNTYDVYARATARVYHADFTTKQNDWRYSQLKGVLVFGRDRVNQSSSSVQVVGNLKSKNHYDTDRRDYWFRLIDETWGRTLWIFKLPETIEYQRDKPFFHVFSGRSRMWGLLFSDDNEAATFSREVVARFAPTAAHGTQSRGARHMFQRKISRQASISTTIISAPAPDSFVHVAHLGISKEGVVEMSKDIHPSWAAAFAHLHDKAG